MKRRRLQMVWIAAYLGAIAVALCLTELPNIWFQFPWWARGPLSGIIGLLLGKVFCKAVTRLWLDGAEVGKIVVMTMICDLAEYQKKVQSGESTAMEEMLERIERKDLQAVITVVPPCSNSDCWVHCKGGLLERLDLNLEELLKVRSPKRWIDPGQLN